MVIIYVYYTTCCYHLQCTYTCVYLWITSLLKAVCVHLTLISLTRSYAPTKPSLLNAVLLIYVLNSSEPLLTTSGFNSVNPSVTGNIKK